MIEIPNHGYRFEHLNSNTNTRSCVPPPALGSLKRGGATMALEARQGLKYEMDQVMTDMSGKVSCPEEMPGLKANLVALKLYDPWKLIDFVEIEGALGRVLQHQTLFDFSDSLQRLMADELTVSLKQHLKAYCRQYGIVAPSSCASVCNTSPERSQHGNGKATNEGAKGVQRGS